MYLVAILKMTSLKKGHNRQILIVLETSSIGLPLIGNVSFVAGHFFSDTTLFRETVIIELNTSIW